MKFRTDFLVLPALVHAVEKGWLTLDEALAATNDPQGWTNENQRLEQHLHLNALLYDRKLLSIEMWQKAVAICLPILTDKHFWQYDNDKIWYSLLLQHLTDEYLVTILPKLVFYAFPPQGHDWLKSLIPRFNETLWQQLWETIQQPSHNIREWANALEIIAPFVPDEWVSLLFAAAMTLQPQAFLNPRSLILGQLVPRLNETEFAQAVTFMHQLYNQEIGVNEEKLLTSIFERLSPSERQFELATILTWTSEQPIYLYSVLRGCATFLDNHTLTIALEQTLYQNDVRDQCLCLLLLFPYMESAERHFFTRYMLEQLTETSNAAFDQLWMFTELIPYLAECDPNFESTKIFVEQKISSAGDRTYALIRLSEFAPASLRSVLLKQAAQQPQLAWSSNPTQENNGQSRIIQLMHLLDETLFEKAFASMMASEAGVKWGTGAYRVFVSGQAHALTEMFPRLNDDQIRRILTRMQNVEADNS